MSALRPVRPVSVIIIAWLYIVVGVVGFVYHVTDIEREPGWRTATILAVRVLAVVIGAFMLRGAGWARWAALGWMAFHVVLGALHSWGDALTHGVLLGVFAVVLLRPSVGAYFGAASGAPRIGV